jgi:lipid A 4'-phosphatase
LRNSDPLAELAAMLAVVLLAFMAFDVLPPVDLWVSGLFHDPETGIWTGAGPLSDALRNTQWNLSYLLIGIAVIALLRRAIFKRESLAVPTHVWVFVVLLYAAASGVMANLVLKSHWGRARPADVGAFGGDATFTLPNQIADQCLRNCSFVSGEVTAATILAICVIVILRHARPAPPWPKLWVALAVAFPVINAVQRISSGRHFLSDALFAALFTCIIARLLWRGLNRAKHDLPRS